MICQHILKLTPSYLNTGKHLYYFMYLLCTLVNLKWNESFIIDKRVPTFYPVSCFHPFSRLRQVAYDAVDIGAQLGSCF